MNKHFLLLLAFALPLLSATAAERPPVEDRHQLANTLGDEGFWLRPQERSWSAREVALLSQLSVADENPVIRLRASKLLIELAGSGRATAEDLPIVVAAFRYIEQHPDDPTISRLLASPRMTHYTTSRQSNGSVWFLIESVHSANRGGLNFRWDAEKKQVELVKGWGRFAQQ